MKNILGFMMVNAPHSALNNAGMDEGARTENCVVVKKIRKGKDSYVYVSPQAFRYWLRDTLKEVKDWRLSPITREAKIAFTSANPINYEDDDMFGYMRAQGKAEGGTVTRISPFKCSPLISVIPNQIVSDYGVMSRHEGDPVPYEHEFYSTVFKGIFSIDLDNAGKFIKTERAGYRNITDKFLNEHKDDKGVEVSDGVLRLDKSEIVRRVSDMITVLPYLNGGAKSTGHLTDVSPKVIILTAIKGGNHIFMDIAENKEGVASINVKSLEEILTDYDNELLCDVFIGIREGFNDNVKNELESLAREYNGIHAIRILTPNAASNEFAKIIQDLID